MNKVLVCISQFVPRKLRKIAKSLFPGLASLSESSTHLVNDSEIPQFLTDLRLDLNRHINKNPLWRGRKGDFSIISYSPFPPSSNGIGVYASNLVTAFRERVRVGVRVVGDRQGATIEAGVFSASLGFVEDQGGPVYELFHLGNGLVHKKTWENLHQRPGVVILHDVSIQDIPLLPSEERRFRKMPYSEKVLAHAGRIPESVPCIIVHSDHAAAMLQKQFTRVQKVCPPIHILSTGHPVKSVLAPKSIPAGRPLLGVFGFQYQSKNPQTTYEVISKVAKIVSGRAVVCGHISVSLERKLRKLWIQAGNTQDDLTVTGEVPLDVFEAWISKVDLGVQLRSVSNGESSGPISQLISAGVPTLATAIGAVTEYPNEVLVKLPLEASVEQVSAQAVRVLNEKSTFDSLSRAGVDYFRSRTFDVAALEIIEVLRSVNQHHR